jgi:hypothetical protein
VTLLLLLLRSDLSLLEGAGALDRELQWATTSLEKQAMEFTDFADLSRFIVDSKLLEAPHNPSGSCANDKCIIEIDTTRCFQNCYLENSPVYSQNVTFLVENIWQSTESRTATSAA